MMNTKNKINNITISRKIPTPPATQKYKGKIDHSANLARTNYISQWELLKRKMQRSHNSWLAHLNEMKQRQSTFEFNGQSWRLSSTLINKSAMNYSKDNQHTTWTIGLDTLDKPSLAQTSLPKEVYVGRKYIFIVKIVLLNYDLEKSGGRLGHTHLMCGTQSSFSYDGDISFQDFLKEVEAKVRITIEDYKMEDLELECIQVLFFNVGLSIEKEKSHENNNRSKSLNKLHKDDFVLPIYTDISVLGSPLNATFDNNGYINNIETGISKNFIDLVLTNLKLLKQSKSIRWDKFDHNWKFYEVELSSRTYILGLHTYDKHTVEKVLFTNTGNILYTVTDYYNNEGEFVTRISGNKSISGNKDNIHEISRELKLRPISNVRNKSNIHQYIPNTNIGSLDCETFTDADNINKIYALGFKHNINKESHLYYINDYDGDSNKMVINFIDDIMSPKFNNITFYCHNWGGYDAIFIIKILNEYNQKVSDKYKMTYHFRDNKIYKLNIHDSSDRNRRVTICDSYTILNTSLRNLCLSFDLDDNKLYFPYKFVSRETLNYKGTTPSRDYYNDICIQEYNKLLSDKWSLKDETLIYLNKDIEILIKILNKANNQLFNDYNVSISDKSTIAGLATKIFMKDYYKGNIPFINKSTIYSDIVKGYYGGITEVYRPYGEDLYYYDVNSLYPSVCLDALPGVNNAKKIEYVDRQPDIKDIFGFYYCDVETPKDLYIGVLPVRNKNGLLFPLGKFSGWYFSEELKFAVSLGYKIKIYKGYLFEKQYDTFKSYVDKIYSIKNNPINITQKSIAKGLLNNLLGRFGISLYKPVTKIVDFATFSNIMEKHRIVDHKNLYNNNILVTYYDILDPVLVEKSGLTLEEVWDNKTNEVNHHTSTSIVISAAVTAYARIAISKIKLDILKSGGKIYYSDTDSIITDKELPSSIVSSNELGKLKLEHIIKKGIFISGKTYCFINDKGEFINRAKGVKSSSLDWKAYIDMLNNLPVIGEKQISKADWEAGDVKISKQNVVLSADVYKKREKVYENNIWSNTKPISIGIDSDMATYPVNYTSSEKNILKKTPLTTKRFYSNKHIFDDRIVYENKSKSLVRNYLERLNTKFKVILNYAKSLITDLLTILLLIMLFMIYITSNFDTDIVYDYPETSVELSDLNELNIIDINDGKNTVEKVCTIKGHGLLDDSLYNSDEYTYNYLSTSTEELSSVETYNKNTCVSNPVDKYNQDTNNILDQEKNIIINYGELSCTNDDLFVNKIKDLEDIDCFKSIIIEPYNNSKFDPHKTYISYELDDNAHLATKMLVELADNQAAVPIDASFTVRYKPMSIVRDCFYEEDVNTQDTLIDNVSIKSDESDSNYFSMDSTSYYSESDYDNSTIDCIIQHYSK